MELIWIAIVVAVLLIVGATALRARSRRAPEAPRVAVDGPGVLAPPRPAPVEVPAPVERPRLRDRLGKARALLADHLAELRLRARIDDAAWDGIEEMLIVADVGVATTQRVLDDLRSRAKEEELPDVDALVRALKEDLADTLRGDRALAFEPGSPNVWMFVGVNGTGKTTTVGKVARREAAEAHSTVLVAADTFRAAAADQLVVWAERAGAEVVRAQEGADPGSVVFDGMDAARSRRADLVLVDTAGRLHTKANLMEELAKLKRIVERSPGALKEVLLVIDATTGQNGLVQARQFTEAVDVTGVVLTKLDGTAKGGIVVAIQQELGIPVKLVGVGEGPDDLIDFDPDEFVEALFA
jgi:fused signal recognition particle receptor